MDRRYYRQYENFDTVVPRIEDFPVLNSESSEKERDVEVKGITNPLKHLKLDDLVLLGVIALLLAEEEKDITVILGVAFLFLAEYIF
ncbi:MAG: hypothetical protein IJE46_03665 [Clostridia bacterium]|nr:hypothetical protein [Clostridia bacterium]